MTIELRTTLAMLVIAGCGPSDEPPPAAPLAAPPPAAPSPVPAPACAAGPIVAFAPDGHPTSVAVGRHGAIVVHRADSPLVGAGIVAVEGEAVRTVAEPATELAFAHVAFAFDAEGEAAAIECRRSEAGTACVVHAPWSPSLDGIAFAPTMLVSQDDDFAAVGVGGRVVVALDAVPVHVWILAADTPPRAITVELDPSPLDNAWSTSVLLEPSADGSVRVVRIVDGAAMAAVLDAEGDVAVPAAPTAIPPHVGAALRALRADETTARWSPGLEHAYQPSFARVGTRWLAAWAEGLVRVGWLDPAEPALEISWGASGAILAASAEEVAVTWRVATTDESAAGARLAFLRCRAD